MSEKKSSWLVKSIWLVTLGPLIIAWAMAYTEFGLPGSTKNNGELQPAGLIVPEPLISEQNGKWGLIVVTNQCDDICQKEIYRLQQLFISMGKNDNRLRAIWLSNQAKVAAESLSIQLDYNKVAHIHDQSAFKWFNDQNLAWTDHSIWLVDPLGNLVLRFSPDLSGRQMMSDINWLLKASRIG